MGRDRPQVLPRVRVGDSLEVGAPFLSRDSGRSPHRRSRGEMRRLRHAPGLLDAPTRTILATLDLGRRGPSRPAEMIIPLPQSGLSDGGTLVMKVVSPDGRPVRVDGLALDDRD